MQEQLLAASVVPAEALPGGGAVAFSSQSDKHDQRQQGTEDDGYDRCFRAESSTGNQFRTTDRGVEYTCGLGRARDAEAKYISLGEIPGPMDSDGKPQRTGILEGHTQQDTCLYGYSYRTPYGCIGLEEMGEAKQESRDSQSPPQAKPLVNHSEQDSPEDEFLRTSHIQEVE